MNNDELMSRRRFFKKAAKGLLPMLGAFVAAPTILTSMTSCSKDGCDGCEDICMDNCFDTCAGSCFTSCSGSSTKSTCSNCANDCSSSCKETCHGSCENTCSNSCEGSTTGKPTTGIISGHEYVDLGLSVLWATCNIGASSPEEKGEKLAFVFSDLYKESGSDSSWYSQFLSSGIKEDMSISGTSHDTAKIKWGNQWRMPTKDEIQELWVKCETKLIRNVGMKVTSKINGKSILFPFTSYDYNNVGYGTCWSGDTVIFHPTYSDADFVGAYVIEICQVGDDGFVMPEKDGIFRVSSYYNSYSVIERFIRPVAERKDGDVSTCNGTCTANCSSNCSSTCKNECSRTCKGSCGNDCTSGCKTTCTKTCAESCSSDCTGGCSTGCSSTCKGTCSGGCSSGCSGGCKGTCSGSCGSGCSGGCSGCTAACKSGCEYGCIRSCANDCSSSCTGGCDSTCRGTCVTTCSGTCYTTCKDTCFGSCRITCEGWTK